MKNVLFILFIFTAYCNAQDVNQSVDIKNETNIKTETNSAWVQATRMKAEGEGMTYKGKGVYRIQQTGKNDAASYKRQVKKAIEKIKSYSEGLNLNYQIINTERSDVPVGFGVARVIITFKLLNSDGTVAVNELDFERDRAKAKKELIELKEFLDLGIITQEEFDKRAASLKKILLGGN